MSDLESAAAYEWLLSDHPDARAERDRRRGATYQDQLERTGTVLAWAAKINAAADVPEAMRNLAATMGPLATESAERAEVSHAVPDAEYVARARTEWETHMRVSGPDSSWDYRYPDRYVGEAAASQPRPGTEPEPEAGT